MDEVFGRESSDGLNGICITIRPDQKKIIEKGKNWRTRNQGSRWGRC